MTRTNKPALKAMYNEICGFIGQEANLQLDEGPDSDEEDLGEQVAVDLFRELDGEPEGDEDVEIGDDDVEDVEAEVEASQASQG